MSGPGNESWRILLVSSCLPHAGARHAGARLVHYLLDRLAERHRVEVLARRVPGEEGLLADLEARYGHVETIPAPGVYRQGSPLSLFRSLLSVRQLAKRAARRVAVGDFDVCQVEFTEAGIFWSTRIRTAALLSCHDLWARKARRRLQASQWAGKPLAWSAGRLQSITERHAWSKFAGVFTLSDTDQAWAAKMYPEVATRVLRYPAGIGFRGLPRRETPGRVAFLGTLNRRENELGVRFLVREVWPHVLRERQEAEFVVAGAGASPALVDELTGAPRVNYLGPVESVEEFYLKAAIFVAPVLIGGGVIVKLLDALAAGVATVTTSLGNATVAAEPGRDLLVADSAEETAARVVELLGDAPLRRRLSLSGQKFVMETRRPGTWLDELEGAYRELLTTGRLSLQRSGT